MGTQPLRLIRLDDIEFFKRGKVRDIDSVKYFL